MTRHAFPTSTAQQVLHRRFRPVERDLAPEHKPRIQGLFDTLVIVLFGIAISAPLAGHLLGWKTSDVLEEKRNLAPPPDLRQTALADVPAKFDRYWQDHFGFRAAMIRQHNYVRHDLLADSNAQVIVGQQGWLFFAGAGLLEEYTGRAPFPAAALARWSEELTWRHQWLAKQGIRYAFVIAPNKSTVYPEYLPPALRNHAGVSRCMQLRQHLLASHCPAQVFELTEALCRAKEHAEVYFPTDSHWNGQGFLVAHRVLWDWLRRQWPDVEPDPLARWRIVRTVQYGYGDLRTMLGLSVSGGREGEFLASTGPKTIQSATLLVPPECVLPPSRGWDDPVVYNNPQGKRRLLLFGDSFWHAGAVDRKQPLADSFAHSAMVTLYPTRRDFVALVRQQRPDVVIEERVERSLFALPINDLPVCEDGDTASPGLKSIRGVMHPEYLFDGLYTPDKLATAPHNSPIVIELAPGHHYRTLGLQLFDRDGRYYKFLVEGRVAGQWQPLLDASREGRSGKVTVPLPNAGLTGIRLTSFYNSDEGLHPRNKVFHLAELQLLDHK